MRYDISAAIRKLARKLKPMPDSAVREVRVVRKVTVYCGVLLARARLKIALVLDLDPAEGFINVSQETKEAIRRMCAAHPPVILVAIDEDGTVMAFSGAMRGETYYLCSEQALLSISLEHADWIERVVHGLRKEGFQLYDPELLQ